MPGAAPSLLPSDEDECGSDIPQCTGPNCCDVCTNSKVDLSGGTYEDTQTDIEVKTSGIPVRFERSYTSRWKNVGTPPVEIIRTLNKTDSFTVGGSGAGGGGGGTGRGSVKTSYSRPAYIYTIKSGEITKVKEQAFGWTSPWFAKVFEISDNLAYFNGTGRIIYFKKENGIYKPTQGAERYTAENNIKIIPTLAGYQILDKTSLKKSFERADGDG